MRSLAPEEPTAAEIVDLIGVYADLKPKGDVFKAYCPLCHKDDYSFTLDPEKGRWRCSRCGEEGDVYHFFERLRRCSSEDAYRFVNMLLASNRRQGETAPAVIRKPVVRPKRSEESPTAGGVNGDVSSRAAAPKSGSTGVPPAPAGAEDVAASAIAGSATRSESAADEHGDSGPDASEATGRDGIEPVRSQSPGPAEQLLARAEVPVSAATVAELARCAETARPVGAGVAEPASATDLQHILKGVADCIGETPACRGIAFIGDDASGEPEIAAQHLDELGPDDVLDIERLMRLAVAGASEVLGGTDEGAGNTVVTLRSSRHTEPLDLVWCPLERGPVRLHALMSIDPQVAEGLLIMRLRCCVNRIVDH